MLEKKLFMKIIVGYCLAFLFCIHISHNCFADGLTSNDVNMFITKSEFLALKEKMQNQIDTYNARVDNKINDAISSYLSSINYGVYYGKRKLSDLDDVKVSGVSDNQVLRYNSLFGKWQNKTIFTSELNDKVITYGTTGEFNQLTNKGSTTNPIYINSGVTANSDKYAGGTAITLNGTSKASNAVEIYAPTSLDSTNDKNKFLKANGINSSPTWDDLYNKMWPIGCLYITMVENAKPSFGTWVMLDAYYYLCSSSSNYGTKVDNKYQQKIKTLSLESTALSDSDIPSHSHTLSGTLTTSTDGNHKHGVGSYKVYGEAGSICCQYYKSHTSGCFTYKDSTDAELKGNDHARYTFYFDAKDGQGFTGSSATNSNHSHSFDIDINTNNGGGTSTTVSKHTHTAGTVTFNKATLYPKAYKVIVYRRTA